MTPESAQSLPRIGIVASRPLYVEGLIAVLAGAADICGMELNGLVQAPDLDLAILDAPVSILDIVRTLRQNRPSLRLIVSGQDTQPGHIASVISAGAHGYLAHTATRKEVEMAVSVVMGNSIWAPRRVLADLVQGARTPESAPLPARLTPRETEVLGKLRKGLSDRSIAACLGISHRTVQQVVSRLLAKAGVSGRLALVIEAERLLTSPPGNRIVNRDGY